MDACSCSDTWSVTRLVTRWVDDTKMTLNPRTGRMFKSVGWTWNPLAGCGHGCKYCYAARQYARYGRSFTPAFRYHYLSDKMPNDGSWIFVGSMGDTFCDGMEHAWIQSLLVFINTYHDNNKFLLVTKNPERFLEFMPMLEKIKDKVILGTTLETTGTTPWSTAPKTVKRAEALELMKVMGFKTFLSLEPLADFDFNEMIRWIIQINPEAVEIGLENYTKHTSPPPEEKIKQLIYNLDVLEIPYILKENLEHLYDSSTETVKKDGV